jgi:pimeloyl-ACP methyl ester carboxylesterase
LQRAVPQSRAPRWLILATRQIAARPGFAVLQVSAQAEWLVCREVCIPESASVRFQLPVAPIAALPDHDVRDRLGAIAAPTLVVVGELDEETPPAYSETLAAGITGARLEVIPGVGHLTPFEAPAALSRLLRDHIDMVEAR